MSHKLIIIIYIVACFMLGYQSSTIDTKNKMISDDKQIIERLTAESNNYLSKLKEVQGEQIEPRALVISPMKINAEKVKVIK